MSATQTSLRTIDPRRRGPLGLIGADIFALSVAVPVISGLAWLLSQRLGTVIASWRPALIWLMAIALLNLLDIRNVYGLKLAPDVPLTAAVAIFFAPSMAGMIAFLGSCDPRELRGEIRVVTTLFNRSQIALSVYLAAQATHAFGNPTASTSSLVMLTLVALGASLGSNYILVGVMSSLIDHVGAIRVLARMQLGRPADFGATILAWGMMAFLLSAAYEIVSWWAVVAFCIPSVLGRQVLDRSQQLMKLTEPHPSVHLL